MAALLIGCLIYRVWASRGPPTTANAYVFYANSDHYACSALVNAHILQHVIRTKYPVFIFTTDHLSPAMQRALQAGNATVIKETPLPLHAQSAPYYEGCLLKLAAFKLHQHDASIQRLLVLDADQLILRDVDRVFDLPLTDFMAPPAYWLQDLNLTSTCMLIRPGPSLWEQVAAAATGIASDKYDMDLVNDLFGRREPRLSARFATLNSHWEDWNVPAWMNASSPRPQGRASDQDLQDLYNQTAVLHFTAAGKPWMYDTQQLRQMKPDAHPLLADQWVRWRSLAMQVCPSEIIDHV
ncbi:hypothetical protein UVI_02036340 [Ustilaginoidea virens]|uniref:Nucleotide-diphospho-sugar transferase n=1 Tax=Ustilaginoidea virens TaxID=1159556 RepID=A0A1B5L603_USTVR|nr:hypothetical protein UVI_02036340 [Ustilaginoidea virens]